MEIHFPINIKQKLLTAFKKHPEYFNSNSKSPQTKPIKIRSQKHDSDLPSFSSLSPVFRKTLDENLEIRKHSPLAEYTTPKISVHNSKGMHLDILSISPTLLHTRYKSQLYSTSRRRLTRIKSQGSSQSHLARGSQDMYKLNSSPVDSCKSARCVNFSSMIGDHSQRSPHIFKLKDDVQKIPSLNLNIKGEISPSVELSKTKNTLDCLKKELREISGIETDRALRSDAEVFNPRFNRIGKAYSQKDLKYYKKFMKLHAKGK